MMRMILVAAAFVCCGGLATSADPDSKRDPAAIQGRWRLSDKESVFVSAPEAVTEELPGDLSKVLAEVRIDGARMYIGPDKEPVSLASDVRAGGLRASAKGFHLLCLTFKDGRAVLGSYKVDGESLEVRFPHTCVCGRSGMIARFVRPGK